MRDALLPGGVVATQVRLNNKGRLTDVSIFFRGNAFGYILT